MDINPITIAIGVAVFVVLLIILSKLFSDKSSSYAKKSLDRVSRENYEDESEEEFIEERKDGFADSVRGVPILGYYANQLKVSGSSLNLLGFLVVLLVMILATGFLIGKLFDGNWPLGFVVGTLSSLLLTNVYLGIKADKRNRIFLDNFPDAIDVIVRSVKSGHPLLASLRMIAQNTDPPISNEFQKVVDEVSYGRPLPEALKKMSERIGILDINFFVVILSVQQETGGNLAEVLTNLSNIVRKRKQLRLKIRALTAEGRITGWIFAAIPMFQLMAVYFLAPDYLEPLFKTDIGQILFFVAVGFIAFAIYISKKMCNVDI